MLAISFLAGVYYIQRVSKRDSLPFDQFLTIAYIMVFGGVIGARLGYAVLHLEEFSGNWGAVFNPFQSGQFGIAGLNLYGGVLLAIGGTVAYCRWKRLSVLDVFDYFSPTLGLGMAITRIGCFLNGCCFGTPCDLPWAVKFPVGSIPWTIFGEQHLHPSQLYSSAYGLILFILLHQMMKRRKFVGQLIAVLFMTEAVFRFAIEYVRYYEEEMILSIGSLDPTYNQLVSVSLFLLGLGIYWFQRRKVLDRSSVEDS